MEHTIHQGRNIKRFREMLGIKQDALASELGEDWTQKKVSLLEQKDTIEPGILQQVAVALNIPVQAIENFDEQDAISIISNTFTSHDSSTLNAVNHQCTFDPLDKWLEVLDENKKLYERLLQSEKEKVQMLERLINKP